MDFDRSLISSLPKSMHYFTRALVQSCNTFSKGKRISEKPEFVTQTEEFNDFVVEISEKHGMKGWEKFHEKVLKNVYDLRYTDIINKIFEEEGKANDSFMSNHMEFRYGNKVLPISIVYKTIIEHAKTNPIFHPMKILLGFYSVMFYTAVMNKEPKTDLDLISDNINLMIDKLEEFARPPPQEGGFMNDMMSKFKNMDLGKATEMLESLSQNPHAPPDLKEHKMKLKDVMKSPNPTERIGEFLKDTQEKMAKAAENLKRAQEEEEASKESEEEEEASKESEEEEEASMEEQEAQETILSISQPSDNASEQN